MDSTLSRLDPDLTLLPAHPEPQHRNFLVYCDESGIDGNNPYVGFGALWMPWERRGDFTATIKALRNQHRYNDEIKWKKVKAGSVKFYLALVDEFFRRSWLSFHCKIMRKGVIDRSLHKDYDEALRKHFGQFLADKIKRSASRAPNRHYYVRLDPFPSYYKKADEAAHKIVGNMLKNALGNSGLEAVDTRDSKAHPGIQLADLLLGATMSDYQGTASAEHKHAVSQHIASHLQWKDMKADTWPNERKFNIWYFHDPTQGPREIETRRVKLRIPLPRIKRP